MHPALRVTFVIQKLAGLPGGAERVLIDTARSMAARGMQVDILSYDRHAGPPAYDPSPVAVVSLFPIPQRLASSWRRAVSQASYARRSRIEVLINAVPNLPLLTHLKWALTHGMFAHRLRAALRQRQPDVVVAFLPPAITAAAWALRGLPAKHRPALIASTHNLPAEDFDDDSPRWDQNPLYRARARAALAEAQAITILQPEFASWFPPALRARLVVMPNAVQRLSAPLAPSPPRQPLILAVGRLTKVKRYDLLIEAFARIAQHLPDWRVVLYGEGGERAGLQARIAALGLADRITLPGTTYEIAAQYDQAALLCHPASFEGFGLSVAEAMVHGLPVLAFADCPGANQLIQHEVDGLLLPALPNNIGPADLATQLAAQLGDGLERLAQDAALRNRLGLAAQNLAHRFAPERVALLWIDLLEGAAQAAGKR